MLRNLDIRIGNAIEKMIRQKIRCAEENNPSGVIILDTSWVTELCNVQKEFSSLADTDCLAIIPDLVKTFDMINEKIMSIDNISENMKDSLLFEVSTRRHQVLDKRVRELLKGKGGDNGEW